MRQQIVPLPEIQKKLREFKLSGIVNSLEIRIKQAEDDNLGYAEFLSLLLEDEVNRRADNRKSKLYRSAKLPFEKGIEDFDFRSEDDNLGYAEFLSLLLEDEVNRRADNRKSKLYRSAKLPFEKGIEDFDF